MKQFNITFNKLSSLKVTLKKTIVQANITIKSIPLRLYAIVKNKLTLKHEVLLSIHKLTGGYHIIGLKQNTTAALRTIFDKAANAIGLYTDSPADILLTKTIKDIFHKIYLTNSNPVVVLNKAAGKGRNVNTIIQHGVIGELLAAAGKGRNKMLLKQTESLSSHSVKWERTNHKVALVNTVAENAEKFTGFTPNILGFASRVETCLTKLRLLGEMDLDGNSTLTLADFDDITLENIDYITI